MKKMLKSLEEVDIEASYFLRSLRTGNEATVVALYGDLGAGKTTFVKALSKIAGIPDDVTSPTFVLMKKYDINIGGFTKLIHIDAYRFEKEVELERLGWADMLNLRGNLILLEWPEKVSGIVPKDAIKLKFTFIDENTREIEYL